jgi:hypothetical protein
MTIDLTTMVAARLSGRELDVQLPVSAGGPALKVTSLPDIECYVEVHDSGYVLLEYWYRSRGACDPRTLTAQVVRILREDSEDGTHASPAAQEKRWEDENLIAAVGRALKASGLAVGLDAYFDHDDFSVSPALTIASPGRADRGEVRISEDGGLVWECHYPGASKPGDVADSIAEIVSGVLSLHKPRPAPADPGRGGREAVP